MVDTAVRITRTVADEVASWLVAAGARRVFTVPALHVQALLDAVAERLPLMPVASEVAAGFMADGAARMMGTGVLLTSGGPGLAAALPALTAAVQERSPVLALVGQSALVGGLTIQLTGPEGSDDIAVLTTVLRGQVFEVRRADELPAALDGAGEALAARTPVAIAIPQDVQSHPIEPGHPRGHDARQDVPAGIGVPRQTPPTEAVLPYRDVVDAVAAARGAGIVCVDAGQIRHAAHAAGLAIVDCPRTAPMGWAVPAAIGVAATTGSRATALVGDGGAFVSGLELAAAAAHRVDVTVLLCVNEVWGGPYARHLGGPAGAVGVQPPVDWIGLARSMGVPAREARTRSEIVAMLDDPAPGPRVVVVRTPAVDAEVSPPY